MFEVHIVNEERGGASGAGQGRGGVGADEGWAGEVGRAVNCVSEITEELQEREG